MVRNDFNHTIIAQVLMRAMYAQICIPKIQDMDMCHMSHKFNPSIPQKQAGKRPAAFDQLQSMGLQICSFSHLVPVAHRSFKGLEVKPITSQTSSTNMLQSVHLLIGARAHQ